MHLKPRRRLAPLLAAGVSALVLVLSGCIINIGAGADQSDANSSEKSTPYSAGDIMFAQMMIPHHEQALEMSLLALEKSTNPEVRDLAQRIYDGQGPEIEQMSAWIDSAKGSGGMFYQMPDGSLMPNDMSEGSMMGGHAMSGMASEEDLARLESLNSPEFDLLFLQLMVEHHQGALAMVQMIEDSSNAEVASLAQAISNAQKAEIDEMTVLLEGLSNG